MSAAHEIAQWSVGTSIWSMSFYTARAISTYFAPSLVAIWPAPPSLVKTITWGALFGAYSGAGFRMNEERSPTNVFTIFGTSAAGASATMKLLLENESYLGAEMPFGVVFSTYYAVQKIANCIYYQ